MSSKPIFCSPVSVLPSVLLFAITCLCAGCAGSNTGTIGPALIDDRLYFGRTIGGGGVVGDEGWREFLRTEVTPRFPDGLTWWNASGQWRNEAGTITREETFVLELLHPPSHVADSLIGLVIDRYKASFHQESVLWSRTEASVRF